MKLGYIICLRGYRNLLPAKSREDETPNGQDNQEPKKEDEGHIKQDHKEKGAGRFMDRLMHKSNANHREGDHKDYAQVSGELADESQVKEGKRQTNHCHTQEPLGKSEVSEVRCGAKVGFETDQQSLGEGAVDDEVQEP